MVYYIQTLDPQELASRFSTTDIFEPLPEVDDAWKDMHLDKIKAVMDRLPDREADLIRLYFFLSKRQTDIAEIFGITQAAVSYRLKRALDRIRFLIEMPDVSREEIFAHLSPYFPAAIDAQIFVEMFGSTCQSEVAAILGISQGRVRHRFIANLALLGQVFMDKAYAWVNRQGDTYEARHVRGLLDGIAGCFADPDPAYVENQLKDVIRELLDLPEDSVPQDVVLFAKYYKTFLTIRYNFNILREIKLPKWAHRGHRIIT